VALLIYAASSNTQRPNTGQRPSPEKIIEMLDANNDGRINKKETSKARKGKLTENFNQFDINKDGYIDLNELKDKMSKMKRKK